MPNLIKLNTPKNAKLKLYLLHHAGGSHMLYRAWQRELPDWIEFNALELPGRGMSFGERSLESIEDMIELFLPKIETDKPFAFFGHSMGALLAYELTLRLQMQSLYPIWLGLSAYKPPHLRNTEAARRGTMTDPELLEYLKTLGDVSELIANEQVLKIMLNIIRNDFKAIENWKMSESIIHPEILVSLYSGQEDTAVTPEIMKDWGRYISGQSQISAFPGGHFYLQKYTLDVINSLSRDIANII
ncbi:thioesterase domain-containing protein [Xenorhabdus bovienii]|uniref:thioesterase II family protein n=1 Tax=Xenorhabdus bovienii TaxID=40576 RepID=UPI001EDD89E0|nr:thioesterase domain-containing protein [Xenorhabdus bovienii]MCG3463229.1 thioesterase domain-containing protein [Xenorhabdus bovienii]